MPPKVTPLRRNLPRPTPSRVGAQHCIACRLRDFTEAAMQQAGAEPNFTGSAVGVRDGHLLVTQYALGKQIAAVAFNLSTEAGYDGLSEFIGQIVETANAYRAAVEAEEKEAVDAALQRVADEVFAEEVAEDAAIAAFIAAAEAEEAGNA